MADLATVTKKLTDSLDKIEKRLDETTTKVDKALAQPNYGGKDRVFAEVKNGDDEGRYGYPSFAEFCQRVRTAPNDPLIHKGICEQVSKGLQTVRKSPSGLDNVVDSEGHFLVPPTFSNKIFERVYNNDELVSRCDRYTISGNEMAFPAIDEASRADGSRYGGVKAYWLDEAGQLSSSKPKFRRLTLKLKKLACLGYVTEELQSDAAVAMDAFLTRMFGLEIAFRVGDAIVNGDGVGMPTGLINLGSKVKVNKETGQPAATIVPQNIWKMWARMWAPSRSNAIWLYNQDCEAQFYGMKLDVGTGGQPVFLPPGGISEKPYATLLGRPMIPVEFCQTCGTEGDLILTDLSQYAVISKGTPETAMSMHLRFDYAENAYRTIFRIDGNSWWNLPLTPRNGTATLSPVITLQTRP